MAQRGRPRKPTALKLLEGDTTHGKSPINENEPKPTANAVMMPEWLDDYAREEWQRMEPVLHAIGVITDADVSAFSGYCENYSRWRTAEEHLSAEGIMLPTDDGGIKVSPWYRVAQNSQAAMKGFMTEFGMTPASRTRISVDKTASEDDPMEQLLMGGGSGV